MRCLSNEGGKKMPAEIQLEKLINEYGDALLRMCYLYLNDYQLAEDAVQETYIKAMRSYATFEKKSSEKTWITRIAINCCKNVIRTHWFKVRQNASAEQLQMQHHNPIEDFLEKDSLSGAIMKLNKLDKTVIILFYYQELPVKEIAMIINKTENATLQCLRRARIKLKEILKEDGYEGL